MHEFPINAALSSCKAAVPDLSWDCHLHGEVQLKQPNIRCITTKNLNLHYLENTEVPCEVGRVPGGDGPGKLTSTCLAGSAACHLHIIIYTYCCPFSVVELLEWGDCDFFHSACQLHGNIPNLFPVTQNHTRKKTKGLTSCDMV